MDSLPLIPTPPRRRLQFFRHRFVPVLVFFLLLAGAVVLWRQNLRPATFVAQVEIVQADVTCTDAGLLTNLWVAPLQEIKRGDLVAEVHTTDPRTVNNRLDVMRDRMRLIELELTPVMNRQRSAIDYEQLSIAGARVRAELAIAKVNLIQASNELRRVTELFQQKERVATESDFDLAKARFDALYTEVVEKSLIVTNTEASLGRLNFMADAYVPGGDNDPLRQAISMEEAKIRVFEQKMKPIQLLAPIDGVVTGIHRRAGEQISAAAPLVTITSRRSERIVGYLPRSILVAPRLGAMVEVRTRGWHRRTALAKVIGLGPHVEGVTNAALAPPVAVNPVLIHAMGRPIALSLPPELELLPGDIVEVELLP
jgi:multidrug resistance efflux pump